MKTALLLLILPVLAFARVGPDLSSGVDVAYFTKLRMDYAENPQTEFYPMWGMAPQREAIVKAFMEGDIDQTLDLANDWLIKCPVDADVHLMVAMCQKEKGELPEYNYHLGVFYGLLQSITSSGDGKTPATAFKVISVAEEYSLIKEIGGRVKQQALVGGPDGPCDEMTILRRDGKIELVRYFNVSLSMNALDKALSGDKKPEKE